MDDRLNILVICNYPRFGSDASTILDHIDAFRSFSRNHVVTVSSLGELTPEIDLNWFDVVVVHYSIYLLSDYYITRNTLVRLSKYGGLKVLFVQDEYRSIF